MLTTVVITRPFHAVTTPGGTARAAAQGCHDGAPVVAQQDGADSGVHGHAVRLGESLLGLLCLGFLGEFAAPPTPASRHRGLLRRGFALEYVTRGK